MITRDNDGDDSFLVTFHLPAEQHGGRRVSVVGDFNDWDPEATPLRETGASLTANVTLETGRRYQFRYVDDQGQWFDDEQPDDYAPNEYGEQNCVLDLASASVSA